VAADIVRGLKYRGWTRLADFMAELMVGPARRLAGVSIPLLVPVPLAAPRRRERGFNQAALLARALSRSTGWPVRGLLSRTRSGPPLARLGRRQRQAAVEGVYSMAAGVGDSLRAPVRVLIVDDVITTGATGVACGETLARAGVDCLGIVSFARTEPLAEPA
jgi:predicted amidophosphoribosyltransferase